MFDARAAKALKPGDHLTIAGMPGLRLEATATTRTWTYRYKSPVDGRMRQVKIGLWPGVTWAAAVGEWEKLRQARDAGRCPAQERRAEAAAKRPAPRQRERGPLLIREVCALYVERLKGRRQEKGWRETQRLFDRLLGDDADRPVVGYTRRDAYALLERVAQTPVQATMLRQELGGAWDNALDAGLVPDETPNWWRQIMRGGLRSRGRKIMGEHVGTSKRVLTVEEVGALLRWLPNLSALLDDALTLYLWTGLRGGELLAMEGSEVSQEADGVWWTCPQRKTKNRNIDGAGDMRIPLIGRAAVIVERRMQRHGRGHLFPATRRDGSVSNVQQKTIGTGVHYHMPYSRTRPEEDRPRCPVERWAPHDLRRTVRTRLAALGCPMEVAEAVLGHVQPGVRGVYNRHAYDAERRHWLTLIAAEWERAASSRSCSAAGAA